MKVDWREILLGYPDGYDAHADTFSEQFDHEGNVNELLAALRAASEEIAMCQQKLQRMQAGAAKGRVRKGR